MLRVGIAGVGSMAQVYLRLFAAGQIPEGIVTALCSRNRQRMESACLQYGMDNVVCFSDYQAMLRSGQIDVAMICTPHSLHPSMALQALEAGIHPLIEKPVGVDAGEVSALLSACAAHPQLKAGVLYCRRTSPVYRQVKRLVSGGEIGQLKRACWIITNLYRTPAYHSSQSWRGTWSGEGGGLMLTQASHQLDLLVWLCGAPSLISAQCEFGAERQIQVENDVSLFLRYPGGATGQFIASSREFPGSNRLELSGSKGQIILEDDHILTLRRLEIDERDFAQSTVSFFGPIPYTEERSVFPQEDNTTQQAAVVADFLRAVSTGGQPLCSVAEAQISLQIINGAYLSAWQGTPVPFPPPQALFTEALACRRIL